MMSLSDVLRPGARVFVPGMSVEPTGLLQALAEAPTLARGVDFVSVQYPGAGQADYLAVHPDARQTAFFMTPAIRDGLQAGRATLLGLDYLGIGRYLAEGPPMDVAVAHVSPPDAQGYCSAGVCSDFLPLVWPRAARRLAQINPCMPRVAHGFQVHVSEFDAVLEHDAPLTEFEETAAQDDAAVRIADTVAALVNDGDTVQLGVGSVPLALAQALTGHRRLRLHTGMVSRAARRLDEAGALDPEAPIVTGIALGTAAHYAWAAHHPRLRFVDVRQTHGIRALGAIERFVAVNSAVEVDLFGQVNAERSDGMLQAGVGGLPAYAQGALAAPGGRLIICLRATARAGRVSRIVPSLDADGLCTLPRHLADIVVTEYGVAHLRHGSAAERADALIGIAAPRHQEALQSAWARLRGRL